jgi:hypothetical protein
MVVVWVLVGAWLWGAAGPACCMISEDAGRAKATANREAPSKDVRTFIFRFLSL